MFFQTLQNVQSEFLSIVQGCVAKTWSALHAHVQGDHLLTNETQDMLKRVGGWHDTLRNELQ